MSTCKTCQNNGTYYDRRCEQKICAHLGPKNEHGEFEPVMECPRRACSCKAGAEARLELSERIYRQEQMLERAAEAQKNTAERGQQYQQIFKFEEEEEEQDAPQPSVQEK